MADQRDRVPFSNWTTRTYVPYVVLCCFVGGQDVSAARHRLRLRRIVASSQDNTHPGEETLTRSWALFSSADNQ